MQPHSDPVSVPVENYSPTTRQGLPIWRRDLSFADKVLPMVRYSDACNALASKDAEILSLNNSLNIVMKWVDNWEPDFTHDPQWIENDEPRIRLVIKAQQLKIITALNASLKRLQSTQGDLNRTEIAEAMEPATYKMVPTRPSAEMLEAAYKGSTQEGGTPDIEGAWTEMLAVSPEIIYLHPLSDAQIEAMFFDRLDISEPDNEHTNNLSWYKRGHHDSLANNGIDSELVGRKKVDKNKHES